jgi:hypothetical protein
LHRSALQVDLLSESLWNRLQREQILRSTVIGLTRGREI